MSLCHGDVLSRWCNSNSSNWASRWVSSVEIQQSPAHTPVYLIATWHWRDLLFRCKQAIVPRRARLARTSNVCRTICTICFQAKTIGFFAFCNLKYVTNGAALQIEKCRHYSDRTEESDANCWGRDTYSYCIRHIKSLKFSSCTYVYTVRANREIKKQRLVYCP